MATYGSILIDAGVGIVDHGKQADRQPGATVIIGLGGTGSDAVIRLKREVYSRLKPDDVNAVIPRYNNIRYLLVDSDDSKVGKMTGRVSDIDKRTEYFSLANSAIKEIFSAKEVLKNRPEMQWLDYEHISVGAGAIRQVGRFLLVDQARELYDKIKATILSAVEKSMGELNVHICTGLSGGTGSGIFLDVCYMVREVLNELGRRANVCGYFFLPDVNLNVPVITADSWSKYLKANGYAALKELDYCMNFHGNKDRFKMNYGFKEIESRERPVDLCCLISTTDETGRMLKNGYDYALGVVGDFIMDFLVKAIPADGNPLSGFIAKIGCCGKGIALQHGAGVWYNTMGLSVAEMQLSEIATYLGSKLFEEYADLFGRTPTEKERDDFLQASQLRYEDIRKALTRGCPGQIEFPERLDYKLFRERGNSKFVEHAESYLARNKGELEKNSKTFLEKMKDYVIPDNTTSLISRTYKGLCEKFMTRLEYGPFFAQRMLYGSQNQNLIHAIDGFIAQNQTQKEAELRQAERRDEEYENALVRLQNANKLQAKKRMEEYLNALNNLYVHHYHVFMWETMGTILQEYKQQLIDLNNSFFRVLTEVLDTLQKTFAENGKVLTAGVRSQNEYTWKILSVPDVMSGLDAEVKKLDLQQTLYDLMKTMLDNCTNWVNEDENEITKLISDFVLRAFHDATQKTITDYLVEKFHESNFTLLEDKIESEIIRDKLSVDSTPMFWKNPNYDNETEKYCVLTVPYDAKAIKDAARKYKEKDSEFSVRESYINDKISMMRFYSGLPLYAYQGILELQESYEAAGKKAGRHLYEAGSLNWNDWLPDPVPESFKFGKAIERIEKRNKELLAQFSRAEELGIVRQDGQGNWNIMETETLDIETLATASSYEHDGRIDINRLRAFIQQLEQEIAQSQASEREICIESWEAKKGNERQVMLDFYLEAPVLNQILQKELQKREQQEQKLQELQALADVTVRKLMGDFFNTIFTGVLYYGNTISYTYDDFGIEKTIELQNNDMELGDTGAFVAYQNFEKLDTALRDRIIGEAKKRMNEEDCPAAREAVEKLDANMQKRIARYSMLHDETDPIHEELEKFYNEFMRLFQTFKLAL